MNSRENYLRAIDFKSPERIPATISVFWPVWNTYRESLEKIAEQYKCLFPGFHKGSILYEGGRGVIYEKRVFTDPFGCTWLFNVKGYQGLVVGHPLENWPAWKNYSFPDPEEGLPVEGGGLIPWEQVYESMDQARESGEPVVAGMPHGFFFQRLYYLRGFTNLLKDFVRKPPQVYELINALAEYNLELVNRLLKYPEVDIVSFGDDLGTQTCMPINPSMFREFIFPTYRLIFSRVRSRNARVKLHTDGRVVEVFDQLLEAGVNVLNIQDRVNGLENIIQLKDKVCIELDIDRQNLIPLGTPTDIEMHVRKIINLLGSEKGGLMLYAEVHPPTPLENIVALAEVLTKYTGLSSKRVYP